VAIQAVSAGNGVLKDKDLEELSERIERLEREVKS